MKRLLIPVLVLSSIAQLCTLCLKPMVRPAVASAPPGYALVWSDDFTGSTLDTSKWGYLLLNQQYRYAYTVQDAVSLDGLGHLVIIAYRDPQTGHNNTGRIATGQKIGYEQLTPPGTKHVSRYGYIEARIQFDGLTNGAVWSSFFLQSPTYGDPLDNPRAAGTEMDITEHLDRSAQAFSNLHWDDYSPPAAKSAGSGPQSGSGDLSSGFHTYGLEWTPDVLRFYYDCVLVWTVNNSPQIDPPSPPQGSIVSGPVSQANEYIILDNEVRDPNAGGNLGDKGASTNPKMTVDYVRWYEDRTLPATVEDLSVSSPFGRTTMAVSWTAPGDDGSGQTCTKYDLRYSTSPINNSNFNSATYVTYAGAPNTPGMKECQVINGLTECTLYYFAIKTMDEAGNWSAISNVASATTECDINRTASCGPPPADNVAPGDIQSLLSGNTSSSTVTLSWTAPGDDGTSGTASEYDLRYSPLLINSSNFDSAPRATIGAPRVAGSSEVRSITRLCASTLYYFAVKTKDEWSHWSGISNVVTATTTAQDPPPGGGTSRQPTPIGVEAPQAASLSFSKPSPNPARGITSFTISVPTQFQGAMLRIDVFDVAGRRVRSLVDRAASQGTAPIEWNLLNDSGRRVASGLYNVRVQIGDVRKTLPLLVVR